MEYQNFQLKNGIRIIHRYTDSMIAHMGLIINAGSRDENEEEHGIAHFIEHSLFKGTTRRKSYHIISRLEDVGGELNAYTTKEETCIYASFLDTECKRAMELISDIVFHSVFPEKELEKEKVIVEDEINSYRDTPGELIFDDFEEIVYQGTPFERNILGTPQSVSEFTRGQIHAFIRDNYATDEMVLSIIGNIPFKKVIKWAEMYFSEVPAQTRQRKRYSVDILPYIPSIQKKEKGTHQVHCVIGNRAYNLNNEKRLTLHLLNNILGGPGMNSRLNMSLRERNGYSYNVESSYNPYVDTGLFSIYFGVEPKNLDKSLRLITKEFKLLKHKSLGILQLSRAKKQLLGQLAIASENNENAMLSMAKSFLVFNRIEDMEDVRKKLDVITAEDLMEVANEILEDQLLSQLIYK